MACSVSHEALRDHAERVHLSGTDAAVFEAYRELIEQVASDAYDAEGPFDDNGRVLVTSEALARVMRSASISPGFRLAFPVGELAPIGPLGRKVSSRAKATSASRRWREYPLWVISGHSHPGSSKVRLVP